MTNKDKDKEEINIKKIEKDKISENNLTNRNNNNIINNIVNNINQKVNNKINVKEKPKKDIGRQQC